MPMMTILGHNSLDRAFPNIQALSCAQCGIPGRYCLRVLLLLIKMAFEVNDPLFHGWSKVLPLKRHSADLTGRIERSKGLDIHTRVYRGKSSRARNFSYQVI